MKPFKKTHSIIAAIAVPYHAPDCCESCPSKPPRPLCLKDSNPVCAEAMPAASRTAKSKMKVNPVLFSIIPSSTHSYRASLSNQHCKHQSSYPLLASEHLPCANSQSSYHLPQS